MTGIEAQHRKEALGIFKDMYAPAIGSGPVMDYLSQTGSDVLRGADILKQAPAKYNSSIEYADNSIAKSLRDIARVHLAGLGTRIFYANHGGYDNHANEYPDHPRLMTELSGAIMDFFDDLREHNASENVSMLIFTEFGRRMKDNGSGTDHGSGGGAFLIGDKVNGGLYAEYPSIEPSDWLYGEDMEHTYDYRGLYSTVLEQWLNLSAPEIVGGTYDLRSRKI
jgi:uncharacterized protein (DUF1501 family)